MWGKGRGHQRYECVKVLVPHIFMPVVVQSDLTPEKENALAPALPLQLVKKKEKQEGVFSCAADRSTSGCVRKEDTLRG